MTTSELYEISPIAIRWANWEKETIEVRHEMHQEDIINAVCNYFKRDVEALAVKSRKREIVYPRQVLMYLLAINKCGLSLKTIGRMFGGKDHTTVIHARETVKDLIDTSEEVRKDIYQITQKLPANRTEVVREIPISPKPKMIVAPEVKQVSSEPVRVAFIRLKGDHTNRDFLKMLG